MNVEVPNGFKTTQLEIIPEYQVAIVAIFVNFSLPGYALFTYWKDSEAAPRITTSPP